MFPETNTCNKVVKHYLPPSDKTSLCFNKPIISQRQGAGQPDNQRWSRIAAQGMLPHQQQHRRSRIYLQGLAMGIMVLMGVQVML
jgi:hypothetical protein